MIAAHRIQSLPSRRPTPAALALWLGALVCTFAPVAAAGASVGLAELPMAQTRLGPRIAGMIDARAAGDQAAFDMLAANGQARFDGTLLQVQVHLAGGVPPDALPDSLFAAFGGRADLRGIDMMDAWLPLDQIQALIAADRRVAFVQLPWRPLSTAEPVVGQGAKLLREPRLACLGADGAGVTVAVIDQGFEKLADVAAKGEIGKLIGEVENKWGTHGTMCAEVVADVAPGVAIMPVQTGSFTALQAFFKGLAKSGNPHNVKVISHSVIWLGMSFGRHAGNACAMVDEARALGIAWVNASGNSGSGNFYTAPYRDDDGDSRHDFGPGEKMLKWKQSGGQIKLWIDWDDYTQRKMDIDALLYRQSGSDWTLVAKSTLKHGAMVPPIENIQIDKPASGIYGLVLLGGAKTEPGTRLRVMHAGGGNSSFSIYHKNGNVYDPGSCDGVLTVGAAHHSKMKDGPLEAYSSFGPTIDGRQKPEIVAPTGVNTSLGNFSGTSAACPHAAGALALYVQATSTAAPELIERVIADARPVGPATPNDAWGWGVLTVRPESLGWACDPALDKAPMVCQSACGTLGSALCAADCRAGACKPPEEICNADDDDCDGQTDEPFKCVAGSVVPCTTACFSQGTRTCSQGCLLGLCEPPAEACNGQDDDCDGQTDEGFDCAAGAVQPCETSCGSQGTRVCAAECGWSPCQPPAESCNGVDDDCDGEKDQGLQACDPTAHSEGDASGGCGAAASPVDPRPALPLLSLLWLALWAYRTRTQAKERVAT